MMNTGVHFTSINCPDTLKQNLLVNTEYGDEGIMCSTLFVGTRVLVQCSGDAVDTFPVCGWQNIDYSDQNLSRVAEQLCWGRITFRLPS